METLVNILPILVIGVAFYYLLIRPQKNRQKAQQELLRNLEPGTQVMTTAGLFGTVVDADADTVRLEIAPGVVVQLIPAAIAKVMPGAEPAPADDAPASDDAA